MLYLFDHFEIDTEKFELRENGRIKPIEPLVFDLLCFFAQNPNRVIDKNQLIETVWQGRIISDATLSSCIKSARKALGDSGDQQTYIRTLRGRGFEFSTDVKTDAKSVETAPQQKPEFSPSLVILPLDIFTEQKELNSISEGLVENLSTILTRIPLLAITSRSSAHSLKVQDLSPMQIREKTGVTYVLEGSLQKVDETVRANIQLIETKNGFHLWAQSFDQALTNDAMSHLLDMILSRLEPQLNRAIFNDLRGEADGLSGRQLLMRAMSILSLKGWHRTSFTEAADLLKRSIELEPHLALSHAYRALILGLGYRVGLFVKSHDIKEETLQQAEEALDLDNMDSNVLGLAGCALADVGEADRAIPILQKAIEVNPNNAQAWAALGSAFLMNRDNETAIRHIEHGIKISPMDGRLAVWWAFLSFAYLVEKNLEKALHAAHKGCQSDDKTYLPRVLLTVVYTLLGDEDKAQKALKESYRIKPDLSEDEVRFLVGRTYAEKFLELR